MLLGDVIIPEGVAVDDNIHSEQKKIARVLRHPHSRVGGRAPTL